jgi:hypothetical protein
LAAGARDRVRPIGRKKRGSVHRLHCGKSRAEALLSAKAKPKGKRWSCPLSREGTAAWEVIREARYVSQSKLRLQQLADLFAKRPNGTLGLLRMSKKDYGPVSRAARLLCEKVQGALKPRRQRGEGGPELVVPANLADWAIGEKPITTRLWTEQVQPREAKKDDEEDDEEDDEKGGACNMQTLEHVLSDDNWRGRIRVESAVHHLDEEHHEDALWVGNIGKVLQATWGDGVTWQQVSPFVWEWEDPSCAELLEILRQSVMTPHNKPLFQRMRLRDDAQPKKGLTLTLTLTLALTLTLTL